MLTPISNGAMAQTPTESAHRSGPNGMEGWKLYKSIPASEHERTVEKYPYVLMVARRGKIVRRISGAPFVWNWIFWGNGKQVAYENGPLHFGLLCTLTDIEIDRDIASFDCYHGLPANAPAWEKALETTPAR